MTYNLKYMRKTPSRPRRRTAEPGQQEEIVFIYVRDICKIVA
jgi:hypothetical protein